eukprot:4091036-Pyramimonas_sp.AAC.1
MSTPLALSTMVCLRSWPSGVMRSGWTPCGKLWQAGNQNGGWQLYQQVFSILYGGGPCARNAPGTSCGDSGEDHFGPIMNRRRNVEAKILRVLKYGGGPGGRRSLFIHT